jgi:hypothetical protein
MVIIHLVIVSGVHRRNSKTIEGIIYRFGGGGIMIITAREIIDLFNSDFLSEGQLELPKVIRTTDVVKTYKKINCHHLKVVV